MAAEKQKFCPECRAIPGEKHTSQDNGQPCSKRGEVA